MTNIIETFAQPDHIPDARKMVIPDWLLEMSKQMNEQPNRATSHPFWQVRCIRYLPTLDGYNHHHTEICNDDGVVYKTTDPINRFIDYLVEDHKEWVDSWLENNSDDADEDGDIYISMGGFDLEFDDLPEGLRKVPVQEVEEVISTHLTQADAEWFIQRKQHDYPKLYTYVESAYWAPQLRQLQDWIISLTKDENKNGGGV